MKCINKLHEDVLESLANHVTTVEAVQVWRAKEGFL